MKPNKIFLHIVLFIVILCKTTFALNPEELPQELKNEYNIPVSYTEKIINSYKINNNILKAMDRPAESKPWVQYKKIFINEDRMNDGISFYKEHKKTIITVSKLYNIPPEILVAVIGVESNYGKHNFYIKAVDALCTLAFHYKRRSHYFLSELKSFILYTYNNKLDPFNIMGSYAGAIGLPQFMPSSINSFGVDFNKDGVIDLINAYDDSLASIAQFLKKNGWETGKPSIVKIYLPAKFNKIDLFNKLYTVKQLNKMGINLAIKVDENLKGKVIKIDRDSENYDYWVAFNNFKTLKRYNPSDKYSLSIILLSKNIARGF
jgi:membrane-bound lytic murein transglycosylase B